MRAPSPSFRNALATYRMLIEQGPDDDHRALILKILDRWRAHPSCDETWESMGALLPLRPPAGFFIYAIIQSPRDTDRLNRATKSFPQLTTNDTARIRRECDASR